MKWSAGGGRKKKREVKEKEDVEEGNQDEEI